MTRPSRALIDLAALKANYRLASQLSNAASRRGQALAVVKANAYGHGALAVARALEPLAPALAVASCDEALVLRAGGIRKPIVLLEGLFERDEIALCARHDFWPMVGDHQQVEAIVNAPHLTPLRVWLKVDTGMHRLGVPLPAANACYQRLHASPNVAPDIVLATHFASADELDNPFTPIQIERLKTLAASLGSPVSLANSPGLLGWEDARGDWNRPGFMLYGSSPFDRAHPQADSLNPVMTLSSTIMALRQLAVGEAVGYGETWRAERPSVIATLPLGYGDGYPRSAVNGTPILVRGRRAQLAGRVSMDLITVDVTDCGPVQVGDTVELWGKQLPVNEIARHAGASPYELLTRMPARLPRVYQDD